MKKLAVILLTLMLGVCECLASSDSIITGHVYAYTYDNHSMYDLTINQDTGLGIIEAYDTKTNTYIHFQDEGLETNPMLFKVLPNGEKALLLSKEQLQQWGETGYALEAVVDGYVYMTTYKYGTNNQLIRYLNKIDITTGKVVSRYNVSKRANYIAVCNGQVFYDKMINGSNVTVENINGQENEVITGMPIGIYNEYLFIDVWNGTNSASSNVIYAYNAKTKKKTHIVTLDDSSDFFFNSKRVSQSHPLYYIKNGVLYKAIPGAANSIASVGAGKGYSYQLTNVLETPTDYFISFLCFNNQNGFTQLLQINKTSKKKTLLFESPILLSYMPSTFYITDVHTDINGKVYFNAPKIKKTGSYYDVTPMGHTYDLKTSTDKIYEDPWMCLYSR